VDLKHSNVKRAGVTAAKWYGGTHEISATAGSLGVIFKFILPSKGGGETQVLHSEFLQDFAHVLQ
jgi:hypothetical protein